MKTDKLLITANQVKTLKEVSSNIPNSKIELFIRESQVIEIRNFLGAELYKLLQDDATEGDPTTWSEARFTNLWNGSAYTYRSTSVDFYGLSYACAYFTLARLIENNQVNITRYGVDTLTNDGGEDASQAQMRTIATRMKQLGVRNLEEADQFLLAQKNTYPEFYKTHTPPNKTSLSFFKV